MALPLENAYTRLTGLMIEKFGPPSVKELVSIWDGVSRDQAKEFVAELSPEDRLVINRIQVVDQEDYTRLESEVEPFRDMLEFLDEKLLQLDMEPWKREMLTKYLEEAKKEEGNY